MSQPILDQRQIDELIDAINSGRVPVALKGPAKGRTASTLDLTDPDWSHDRIIRRGLPVLDLVFDRLAPGVQVTLTKGLRSPVRVEGSSVRLQKFGEFRRNFDFRRCIFQVIRMEPLRGYSLVVMAPAVAYALIDASMGGLGIADIPGERDISDIEVGLLYKAHLDMLRDFENAWKPWFPLRVEAVRTDRENQISSMLSDDEVCHIGTIKVAGDILSISPIHFILPYTNLEPLLESTSARSGDELDPNWRVNLQRNVTHANAKLTAILGTTQLPTSKAKCLSVGDVIELDRRVDDPIELLVEGEAVFKGRIGKSRLKYALSISELRKVERTMVDRTNGRTLVRKGLISHEQLAVAEVDEVINRRSLLDSIVSRGWVERRVLENALGTR